MKKKMSIGSNTEGGKGGGGGGGMDTHVDMHETCTAVARERLLGFYSDKLHHALAQEMIQIICLYAGPIKSWLGKHNSLLVYCHSLSLTVSR